MGRRQASCAQYSKSLRVPSSLDTVPGGYHPTREDSASRWLRSTVEIESSCTQPRRCTVATTSAGPPRRKRGAYPWADTRRRRSSAVEISRIRAWYRLTDELSRYIVNYRKLTGRGSRWDIRRHGMQRGTRRDS